VTPQKSITDEIIEWLESIAGDVRGKSSNVYWIGEETGIDPDQSLCYCRDCCAKEVDKLNESHPGSEHFSDGGFGSEEDSFKYCESCGAQLNCSLTESGARNYAEDFISGYFSLKAEDGRPESAADLLNVANQLCHGYDKDIRVQAFFAALMAARMNEIISPFKPGDSAPEPPKQGRRAAL